MDQRVQIQGLIIVCRDSLRIAHPNHTVAVLILLQLALHQDWLKLRRSFLVLEDGVGRLFMQFLTMMIDHLSRDLPQSLGFCAFLIDDGF